MESYCLFLIGNFIALPAFNSRYGILNPNTGKYVIETSWQSALQVAGPVGALIGVFVAGPLSSWIGYRWATIIGLIGLNGGIFIFFFGNSLPIFLLSQLLEGVPWGIFVANAPAYCSEVVPMRLRAPVIQMIQMFWAVGAIIVGATTYHFNTYDTTNAFRIPIALQWMFRLPLPSSSTSLPNRLGGWLGKGNSIKPPFLSSDSVDDQGSTLRKLSR
jgi:SP family general alpha glucoside:H+ symporter-like MFS transporter